MREIRFRLAIDRQAYLRYYQGAASIVIVHALDGQRVQFPASALRPFVRHEGIAGEFVMVIDEQCKLQEIRRA